MILMILSFFIFALLNVPIFYSILAATLIYFFLNPGIPLTIIIQKMISGPNSYTLLAVPLYILAGNLMNYGGITKRIFNFANAMVGHIPGGLGQVNIFSSVIFSGMSGSANADAAGLGMIEIKAMREAGFDDDFILGITAASSLIGPIIPPSVQAVLYASAASVSVGSLFLGGLIPGIIMALSLSILTVILAKKRRYPVSSRLPFHERWHIFLDAIPSLMTPILIIGGIWTGWFTATESAIIASVYAAFLSLVVYKDISIKDLPEILFRSAYNSIPFIFIVSASMGFGWIIIREQVGNTIVAIILGVTTNKYIILAIINIILLILGTFMDPAVTIMLLVPILTPILNTIGINMIHFGIVMILNLMIGLLTPPLGSILNTLCTVANVSFDKMVKSCMVFLIPLIIALIIITYVPITVTWLPNLLH